MSGLPQDTKIPLQHEGPPSPTPQLYRHAFFSKEGTIARKALVPTLILPIIYNAVLLWACLSLFFGSLIKNNDVSRISVTAINLDNGSFGERFIDGIKESLGGPDPTLNWIFPEKSVEHGDAWSRSMILEEKTWAVLQISANASFSLREALIHGDASYDPTSAVTLYFASARNQVTTLAVTVPVVIGLVNRLLSSLAVSSTASFLQETMKASDDTSLSAALQCPQCLASPFAVKQVDIIPFSPAVAFGTLNTGLIFLLTFTFNIFTILRAGAELHGHLFTIRTHFIFRTLSSLASYFFLALMYTLGILAFSIPLTGHYTTFGSGFMALWMLNWCTMGACGLAMESVFTIIGMRWAAFFLNIWLITNASGAFASFELMAGFYKYGYAMPFYHSIQATRTIIFGTKSHLGLNFGVLIVWMMVGWGGIFLGMAWRIRKGRRTGVHQVP
ncbi:Nn.00g038340.m01.CDS01 [Neocucurbitaria sp. VM-36]